MNLDLRSSEWCNLLDLSPDNTVVVLGEPPAGAEEGLKRFFSSVTVYQDSKKPGILKLLSRILPEGSGPVLILVILDMPEDSEELIEEMMNYSRLFADIILFNKDTRVFNELNKLFRFKEYAIVPSINDPRWILPLENRKLSVASLDLYQPSLAGAKLKKIILRVLLNLGLSNLLPVSRFYHFYSKGREGDKRLKGRIKRHLGIDEIHLALSTGTPPVGRKVTAQVMNREGEILGYARISPNPDVYDLFQNEKDCLDYLNSIRIENFLVPKALDLGELGKARYLFQSIPSEKLDRGPADLEDIHINSLVELFNKTSKPVKIEDSKVLNDISARLQLIKGNIEDSKLRLLNEGLESVKSKLINETPRLGLVHGDFTPWNTRMCEGKLYIFDWEWVRRDAPPFQDLYHFDISRFVFVKHLTPNAIWEILQGRQFQKLLQDYRGMTKVPQEVENIALIWTLLDDITWYLSGYIREGLPVPETHEFIDVYFNLLIMAKILEPR